MAHILVLYMFSTLKEMCMCVRMCACWIRRRGKRALPNGIAANNGSDSGRQSSGEKEWIPGYQRLHLLPTKDKHKAIAARTKMMTMMMTMRRVEVALW